MLNVDLVTPQGAVLDNFSAAYVTLPTTTGEITILPEHTDLISVLGRGKIFIGPDKKFVLYKGIVEVTEGKRVVVAAERVATLQELNADEINKEITVLEQAILTKDMSEADLASTMDRYQDLVASIQAIRENN